MSTVAFFDFYCKEPYDFETYKTQALGGTDATIVRVAQQLSLNRPVIVAQHNRLDVSKCDNVTYAPFKKLNQFFLPHQIKYIIVINDFQFAIKIKEQFPYITLFFWLHDIPRVHFLRFLSKLIECDIGIITISDYVTQKLLDLKQIDPYLPTPDILRIYNPIDDSLEPENIPYDPNTLSFISSPDKGLEYTLKVFEHIRKEHPQFQLLVSNPGYVKTDANLVNLPGVTNLGYLQHAEAMRVLRKSLCLFCLNHVLPETFGLVLAEANAVGTPVLTHPFGAAPEILGNEEQLVNTYDIEAVTQRLLRWYGGKRPKVLGNAAFRLSTIIKQWEDILT